MKYFVIILFCIGFFPLFAEEPEDSLKIPNTERDAKLDAGYKLYPGVGWVAPNEQDRVEPIYRDNPNNPYEQILDIDAMIKAEELAPPQPPRIGELHDTNMADGFVPIQSPLPGFVVNGGLWYVVIGAVAGWVVTWRLTPLGLPAISGIFIIAVALFLLFPPLCQEIMNVFGSHCGTGELFYSMVPFSVSLLCLGIILMISFYKKKITTQSKN